MFPEHLEAKLTRKPKDPSSSFPNPDYRNKKLMKPLQNHEIVTTDLLNESASSAYRMTAVCDLIPESLDGADLEQ